MDDIIKNLDKTYFSSISNIAETYKKFVSECEIMEKLKSENGEI